MMQRQKLLQRRPLLSPRELQAESVHVALQRAATAMAQDFEEVIKPHNLSPSQYNALRLLRDAGEEGMSCSEIATALITRDPDVTRLGDRLEERGFATKRRSTTDRRVVKLYITDQGLELVASLDTAVLQNHLDALQHLNSDQLTDLLKLLYALLESS